MKLLNWKRMFFGILIAVCIITLSACDFSGGSTGNADLFFQHRSINDFIEQQERKPSEITELICAPDSDTSIKSDDYDKLCQLESLESITFIAISSPEDAQNFFSQLTLLPKLKKVRIEDSRIGSISKLAAIENLEELHIILPAYGGSGYKIDDLDKLGDKGCFDKLRILDLENVQLAAMPDLSERKQLEELRLSDFDLKQLDYNCFHWSGLKALNLSSTSISELDTRIVSELTDLQRLDLTLSDIKDVSFVLDLPQLKEFTFLRHNKLGVDLEILKEHPNYKDSWMMD